MASYAIVTSKAYNRVGLLTDKLLQGTSSVAIGAKAGKTNLEEYAIAIGYEAGTTHQSTSGIAIGYEAGQTSQGQPTSNFWFACVD